MGKKTFVASGTIIINELIFASSDSADSSQVVHVDRFLGSSIWNRSFAYKGTSELEEAKSSAVS